jgi:S1-C subfamily serine protease
VDVLPGLPAIIGSEPEAGVRVAGAAGRHAAVRRDGDQVILTDLGWGTFLADEEIQEAILRDGDIVQLGSDGPRLRFRDETAGRVVLVSDAAALLRALARESHARRSPAFKIVAPLVMLLGGLGLFWSWRETRRLHVEIAHLSDAVRAAQAERGAFEARVEAERRRDEAERQGLEARLEEDRKREDELKLKLADAASGEVAALRTELLTARERIAALESERAVGERIIRDYGAGVCLVQGAYAFYDAAARPLRVRLDEAGEPIRSAGGSLALSADGAGPVHRVDYFGTGFLVDRSGLVLTNRHVAEPWWADEGARSFAEAGFEPRLLLFRGFFPREGEPFEMQALGHSESADLALVRIDPRGRKIPVLPLDATGRGAVAGQSVVVVGYPTGLEAILAKADPVLVRQILEASGMSSERVTEALARRGLIRPSTTQGHIGDITRSDIVFDAPTTQGGSGGPVFNRSGQVVAIEYAVLSKFGGNSFGVPVRHARELIKALSKQKTPARIGAR